MILYRPIGTEELKLIEKSGFLEFPPRLPEQPIFYPVLNQEYAEEIAQWNVKYNADHKGYITQFEVDNDYAEQFEIHIVGKDYHEELWISSEKLEEFNWHIVGQIKIIKQFSK